MYIQLVDKHNFRSPILYLHADRDSWIEQIEKWRNDLLSWLEETGMGGHGTPLTRLDAEACIIDLLRHLIAFYKSEMDEHFPQYEGRVFGTFRLFNESHLTEEDKKEVVIVKVFEKGSLE